MSNRVIKSCVAAATLGVLGVAGSAEAAILAQYQFPSGSAAATTAGTGVTAGSFTFTSTADEGVIGTADGGLSAGGNAFIRSDTTGSSLSAAVADDDYFSFTISATNVGEFLDLSSLTLTLGSQRDNATPFTTNVVLQSSVGGFGTGNPDITGTNTSFSAASAAQTFLSPDSNFDLSAFANVTSITFHIRFFDNLDQNGKLTRFDNVTVNGDVVIPEPVSASLLGLAGLMFGRRRRA